MEHGIRRNRPVVSEWHRYDSRRRMLRMNGALLLVFSLGLIAATGYDYYTALHMLFAPTLEIFR